MTCPSRVPAGLFLLLVLLVTGCADAPEQTSNERTDEVEAADTTAAPPTDVYLAALEVADGTITLGDLVNITARDGYDNQPQFLLDGQALLYTSMRDGQTDIFRYDIIEETHARITDTPATSEYSPTPVADGAFTTVRVEEDGRQRLWQFVPAGGAPAVVLPDVAPVGYHAWLEANRVALFVLGDPPTLQLANVRTGAVTVIADSIGRSLQPVPEAEAVTFIQLRADAPAQVIQLASDGTTTVVTEVINGGDDHAWTPQGLLLMTSGSVLYRFDPAAEDASWEAVADFAPLTLSRLAVSPVGTRLAMVAEE